MNKEDIKHALVSILVGCAISCLTIILQGLLAWLQTLPTVAPGAVGGMALYFVRVHNGYLG